MPRLPSTVEKTRFTLEMSVRLRERLDVLKERVDADSITEVIRRALAVYATLLDMTESGKTLVLRDPDGSERDLLVPIERF